MLAFSPHGIEVLPADDTGIVHLTTTITNVALEVVQSDAEPAGFAIDNVSFTPGTAPAVGVDGGPLPGSELFGDGDPGETLCECGVRFGGDPVNTLSGNFTETYQDAQALGAGPELGLEPTLNSAAAAAEGLFGHGWRSDFEASLAIDGTEPGAHATATFGNGSTVQFTLTALGWFAAPRVTAQLSDQPDGTRTVRLADGTRYSFAARTGRWPRSPTATAARSRSRGPTPPA